MRINNYIQMIAFQQSLCNKKKNSILNNFVNKDTITLSEKASKSLKNGKSENRKIDENINISSYLEKTDKKNEKTINEAGSKLKAQVKYEDEFSAYEDILKDKYKKLASIAKSHSNPQDYISNKYFNPNSSDYVADLTDAERQIAFSYEIQMLNTGELTACYYGDSAFRGLGNKNEGLLNISEGEFHRKLINNQFSNILKNAGINAAFSFNINIDPYSYSVNMEDGNGSVSEQIKKLLEMNENSSELFKHIIISSLDNNHNNKKITDEGKLKFNLYHQCLKETGLDIRELEEKDGTYYTKDGKDIIEVYNDAIEKSLDEGNSYMPIKDAANYKQWFSEMVHSVSKKGWNNLQDMFLDIKVTDKGFIDL